MPPSIVTSHGGRAEIVSAPIASAGFLSTGFGFAGTTGFAFAGLLGAASAGAGFSGTAPALSGVAGVALLSGAGAAAFSGACTDAFSGAFSGGRGDDTDATGGFASSLPPRPIHSATAATAATPAAA